MEIGLLREFVVLARTLNYTKAADALHLTQPTLSKHISAMEKELGCVLFKRDRRSVELTSEGNVFLSAAVQITDTFDSVCSRILEMKNMVPVKVNGVIYDNTVSSIISIASTLLENDGHPPVAYGDTSEKSFLDQLFDDEIDIAIMYVNLDETQEMGIEYLPMTRTRFVAVVNPGSPLARRQSVSIDDLRNYYFIKFADHYSVCGWNNIEHVCRNHGYTPLTRTVVGRNTMTYNTTAVGPEDVLILQSNMTQLRYLSDFSNVKVLQFTDGDAVFHVYSLYKRENFERIKPVLDAYSQARRIVISHGSDSLLVDDE